MRWNCISAFPCRRQRRPLIPFIIVKTVDVWGSNFERPITCHCSIIEGPPKRRWQSLYTSSAHRSGWTCQWLDGEWAPSSMMDSDPPLCECGGERSTARRKTIFPVNTLKLHQPRTEYRLGGVETSRQNRTDCRVCVMCVGSVSFWHMCDSEYSWNSDVFPKSDPLQC